MTLSTSPKALTIGELALRAGLSVETIRFYQREGLVAKPARPAEGFRVYPLDTVARLAFMHKAQGLGFTLREIGALLALRDDPQTDAAAVRGRAAAKLAQIEKKIGRLNEMRETLRELLSECPGVGTLGECSIIKALSESAPESTPELIARRTHQRKSPMKTADLIIEGMHCDGCAKTVEALLAAEPGVKAATVSYGSGKAHVLFDPQTIDLSRLEKVVELAGFQIPQNSA